MRRDYPLHLCAICGNSRSCSSAGPPIAATKGGSRSTRCTTWARTRCRRSRWCGGGWTGSSRGGGRGDRRPAVGPPAGGAARDVRADRLRVEPTRPITLRDAQQRSAGCVGCVRTAWRRQGFRHARHVGGLNLRRFEPGDSRHVALAAASRQAHELASQSNDASLTTVPQMAAILRDIDRLAGEL